jgi:hypothetical protein
MGLLRLALWSQAEVLFKAVVVTSAKFLVSGLSRRHQMGVLQMRRLLRVSEIFRVRAEPASRSLRHAGENLLQRA